MRGGVDPACQARDDGCPLGGEIVAELPGKTAGGSRCVARADDADAGPVRQRDVAADDQCGRRVVDLGQERGIVGLPDKDVPRAKPMGRRPSIGSASIAAWAVWKRAINWR